MFSGAKCLFFACLRGFKSGGVIFHFDRHIVGSNEEAQKKPQDPLSIALILLQLTRITGIHFVSKYSSRFWIFISQPQSAYSPKHRSLWESLSQVTEALSCSSSHTEHQTTLSPGKRCLKCKYLYPGAPPFGFKGSIIALNNQCNSVSGNAPYTWSTTTAQKV